MVRIIWRNIYEGVEYFFILSFCVSNSNDFMFIVVILYVLGDGMMSSTYDDSNLCLLCILRSHFVVLVVGIFYLDLGS